MGKKFDTKEKLKYMLLHVSMLMFEKTKIMEVQLLKNHFGYVDNLLLTQQ